MCLECTVKTKLTFVINKFRHSLKPLKAIALLVLCILNQCVVAPISKSLFSKVQKCNGLDTPGCSDEVTFSRVAQNIVRNVAFHKV